MFYEDLRIGSVTTLGSTRFTQASIVAFARRFDPRVLLAVAAGEPLAASGLHVAAAAMRRLVATRAALRATMTARGQALPELGVSPGFQTDALATSGIRGRCRLLYHGDGVEARNLEAAMGAGRKQFPRGQPARGGGANLLEFGAGRSSGGAGADSSAPWLGFRGVEQVKAEGPPAVARRGDEI